MCMIEKNFIPDLATYDGWKISPPCETEHPYCTMHCPYWYECESLVDYDDFDDDVY